MTMFSGKQLEKAYDFAAMLHVEPTIQRIADSKKSGRAGGKSGVETVTEIVKASKVPLKPRDIAPKLAAAGFLGGGVHTHINVALSRKLIKRTPKGYVKGPEA
jgi:hypothetical protein